jgi:hypothetical protein
MTRALLVTTLIIVCVTSALAGQFGFGRGRRVADIEADNVDYDGRFAFVRLRYRGGGLANQSRGEPPWAHDYPTAERNLMNILREVTILNGHVERSNIVALDDPELFTYPLAYMSEPGYWQMNDEELAGIQAFVRKGGFLIFDDFRGEHWYNFSEQMSKVIPGGRFVEIPPEHPIFHSFFDVNPAETVGYYGKASFQGIYEDNDPAKRLVLVAAYNHDLGELIEYSATGMVPVDLSNDAYKLFTNFIIYGLTH